MARSAATAAARTARRTRSGTNGAGPRRMSGPAASPRAASSTGALALPARVLRAPAGQAVRARAGGMLDSLLYGRGWIGLVAVLLAGIVFFNVDLLQLNRDIARTSERAAGVGRQNARLRLELARLASTERIQRAAAARGLTLPPPGQVRYLRANPLRDPRLAAARMVPPGPPEPAAAAPGVMPPSAGIAPSPPVPSAGSPPVPTAQPAPAAPASPSPQGPAAPAAAPQSPAAPAPPAPSPATGAPGQ